MQSRMATKNSCDISKKSHVVKTSPANLGTQVLLFQIIFFGRIFCVLYFYVLYDHSPPNNGTIIVFRGPEDAQGYRYRAQGRRQELGWQAAFEEGPDLIRVDEEFSSSL